MVALLPYDQQAPAQARIAFRSNASNANDLYAALSPTQQAQPGVVFERAAYLRRKGLDTLALPLVRPVPRAAAQHRRGVRHLARAQAAGRGGSQERRQRRRLRGRQRRPEGRSRRGRERVLRRLDRPDPPEERRPRRRPLRPHRRDRRLADHPRPGALLAGPGRRGPGRPIAAQAFYAEGARHITTFYGQLAAEKAGIKEIHLGKDPTITQADRARFEGRELVRAVRTLMAAGARDQVRVFVLYIDDQLPSAEEEALLVDLARNYGDQDLAMRAVRTAAQRGFILPERGYPLLDHLFTPGPGAAETAFVYSISRQESNFDPNARSAPGRAA
jgi:soluble lytic murein transglycosylase